MTTFSDNFSPGAEAKAGLIPMFVDSTRIILCPEVTVVDDKHSLMCKTCFICPQNDHLQCVDVAAIEANSLETDAQLIIVKYCDDHVRIVSVVV
jgi:hypothetical protein